MERSKNDVWVGLFVLIGAAALLFLALQSANLLSLSFQPTYRVVAKFDNIGGLKPQAAVKSAGVVVGRVESIGFDDKSYQARVTLALENRYAFPEGQLAEDPHQRPARRAVHRRRSRAPTRKPCRRRYHHQHAVRGGAGKPDRPVPVQQGSGRREFSRDCPEEMTPTSPSSAASAARLWAMFACLAGILLALGGCATGPTAVARDPFEPVNRKCHAGQRGASMPSSSSPGRRSTGRPCRRWCAPASAISSAT